jgi:hypothetical protein
MARASSGTSRVHQRRRVAKLRTGLRPALVGEHFQPGLSTSPLRSPLAWRARPHVATRRQDGPFWRRQSAERSPPRTSAEAVSMAQTQPLVSSTRDVPMFTCQRATPGLLPARSTPSSPSSFRTEKISNSLARGKPSTSRGSRRRGRDLPGAVPAACKCLIRCYVSPRLSSSPHGLLQQLLHGCSTPLPRRTRSQASLAIRCCRRGRACVGLHSVHKWCSTNKLCFSHLPCYAGAPLATSCVKVSKWKQIVRMTVRCEHKLTSPGRTLRRTTGIQKKLQRHASPARRPPSSRRILSQEWLKVTSTVDS